MQAVAQDHAVGPVAVVLVELGAGVVAGQAVEVAPECGLIGIGGSGFAAEIVDQDLGVHLFLNVKRRGLDD